MVRPRFCFDYFSPYAYLAHVHLMSLGVELDYRPFDIRTLMPAVGNVPTSVTCKPKNAYVRADLDRWAAQYQAPFTRNPDMMSIDNRRLLRATLRAAEGGAVGAFVAELFRSMSGRPAPLLTAGDLVAAARRVGIVDLTEAEVDDAHWDAEVTRVTDRAAADGVFGAPKIFVADQMFFGNDRIPFVLAALERAA